MFIKNNFNSSVNIKNILFTYIKNEIKDKYSHAMAKREKTNITTNHSIRLKITGKSLDNGSATLRS